VSRKLALTDISDLREYERERESFRDQIIALKKLRRVSVGPHLTFLFENRDTIRFQIQEMARAEKIFTDEGIEAELRVYNPLIPEPGNLSATMFVELTTDEQLREWLPKLVGIERSAVFRLHDGSEIRCAPETEHESRLTRDEITASVHYVDFAFSSAEVGEFTAGPVTLYIDHPNYDHQVELSPETRGELSSDLTA